RLLIAFGCDPSVLAVVSSELNRERTMVLPRHEAGCARVVRWWDALDPSVSLDHLQSLGRIICRDAWLPVGRIAARQSRKYLYARVGSQDNSMYPVLESGSIIRIDPSVRPASNKTKTIFLVQHVRGLRCGYLELLDESRALLLSAGDPRPV